MKNNLLTSLFLIMLVSLNSCKEKTPEEYVDPNIGGVAPLLTNVMPQVHRPHSMVRVFPVTEPRLSDRYFSDRIYGITLNMPRYRLGYTTSVMPFYAPFPAEAESVSSWYDHGIEQLHPWYHGIWLEDYGIKAEWTTSERAVCYRFDYTGGHVPMDSGAISGTPEPGFLIRLVSGGEITRRGENVISGWESVDYARQYFYAVADRPFSGESRVEDEASSGVMFSFAKEENAPCVVTVKVGISYISEEQAKENLEKEIGGISFDDLAEESRCIWAESLGRIKVSGGTEREKRIFYTSLYRTEERMVCQSEYGRYYSGFDRKVHEDDRPFYNDDWSWDTYRNLHALGFILDPERKAHEMQSYARMYRQWGWVPQFPELTEWGGDWFEGASPDWHGDPMIGNHVASIAAEAIRKGITDFDIETLYEGLRKNSLEGTMIPWRAGKARTPDIFYNEHGYFPALAPGEEEPFDYIDDGWEKRQAVSVTLEHSYDDWCLAQIAEYLGKKDDAELFYARSRNYLNLWNPEIGYFAPKNAEGKWIEPFDPQLCDGYGARSWFAEVNACVHVFHVQHDIPGLISLMGGNEGFVSRIDKAYNESPAISKWKFMGMMPDATGLQGMIPAGNEPAFHIPWLYNYAGQPWKTQHRVRQVADVWFDDSPLGLNGDEDGGALCAWYVFAAMGIYPVNPVSGEYALSAPFFEKTEITLPDGKVFRISAPDASSRNKYIASVWLNGTRLARPFITHEDIMSGGELTFRLSDRPCYDAF